MMHSVWIRLSGRYEKNDIVKLPRVSLCSTHNTYGIGLFDFVFVY